MNPRKVSSHQQVQNQISVSPIVLLPPARKQPNRRGMTDPDLATQFLQQFLEPGGIPAALKSNYHLLTRKLLVEAPHFLRLAVVQLQPLNFSLFSCQITDRLCARMKVDSDIYCHWRLLLLTQIVSNTVSLTTHGRRRLLHTIKR